LGHDAFDASDVELLAPVMRQAAAALDNAALFSRLEDKVEELRQAYVRIAREQEAERGRLARELHDGTAQELAGLITLTAVIDRQMGADDEGARETLRRLRRQAEDAYQNVRRSSHALRPLMLDDFGLIPTLGRFLEQFQQSTGIDVDYAADDVGQLPGDVELALFRVAQECLENVRKHSGAERAELRLQRADGHVRLTVQDFGQGMTVRGERGIGLAGMRERVEAVGGSVRVQSEPSQGVTVQATVPVEVAR
jgi:two-component system sensor histidine kinase DegS